MRNICLVLLSIAAISCGSRRVNKSETKESESVKTEVVKVESEQKNIVQETTKDLQYDIVNAEENLQPIDPDKPIIKTETVEGKTRTTTWQNAAVKNTQTDNKSKSVESSSVVDQSVIKTDFRYDNESLKESSAREKITVAKRGFSWWWLLLLILPVWWWVKKKFTI